MCVGLPGRRSFGPGLIFLVLFASRQKEHKPVQFKCVITIYLSVHVRWPARPAEHRAGLDFFVSFFIKAKRINAIYSEVTTSFSSFLIIKDWLKTNPLPTALKLTLGVSSFATLYLLV